MNKLFTRIAGKIAAWSGKPVTFILAVSLVIVWAVTGPMFQFSEVWQLVINTGTTIVTFLMVFLIQNTQNRDGLALQTKLDELILTSDAETEFVGIERLTDKELEELHARCRLAAVAHGRLALRAKAEISTRRQLAADDAA